MKRTEWAEKVCQFFTERQENSKILEGVTVDKNQSLLSCKIYTTLRTTSDDKPNLPLEIFNDNKNRCGEAREDMHWQRNEKFC